MMILSSYVSVLHDGKNIAIKLHKAVSLLHHWILINFTYMKTILIILFSTLLIGCNYNKKDNCSNYRQLSGQYQHAINEGVVLWTGALTGSVEFSGVDFNDMTCTYEITDCETGTISMNCGGSNFETTVVVREDNSIMLNSSLYNKL